MAPFSDPQMNQLMDRYSVSNCQPQFLYQGSQESIVKELQAWIVRRKEVYKEQMELRDESQKASKAILSGQVQTSARSVLMRESMSRVDRVTVCNQKKYFPQ